jgi:hypothetical protein
VTSFDQIARLVAALGGGLVVEMPEPAVPVAPARSRNGVNRKAKAVVAKLGTDTW